ncbi:hypothetical protein ACVDG3_03875 [Meridianimarinicoccus sp. RP-17]|uniref:hypothetical protein n=1 Tax=Meridianimarinicoccus zhengii TaxID=2056810 RepID=UPI001F2497F2|nr:hypothetical protein [Phycocomes zhengii]
MARRAIFGLVALLAACGPAYGPGDTVGLVPVTGEPRATREAALRGNASAEAATPRADAAPSAVPPPVPVRPVQLRGRPTEEGPNVVAFALATDHAVGTARYARDNPSAERAERACERYVSADLAQEAFLRAGGPEGDRLGMDPDGDGYACGWDPERFRRAVR